MAQANSWPLEELHLDVTITDSNDTSAIPGDCFAVVGKYSFGNALFHVLNHTFILPQMITLQRCQVFLNIPM